MILKLRLLTFLIFTNTVMFSQIYVDDNPSTITNNGTSWANAYTNLQTALDAATPGDQIWVAAGTYYPTDAPDESTTDARNRAFHFNTDIKLYGGFAGTESTLAQRTSGNETILSGDLDNDDDTDASTTTDIDDNAHHVLLNVNLTLNAIIDGFTITAGNANGSGSIIYDSQTLFKNRGGGMYNRTSSPSITNINFNGNNASSGGGMENTGGSPNITNVSFSGNTASSGGGMYNNGSSPSITNVSFSGNTASNGGGMYNNFSSPSITNVSFSGNTAFDGGGMYNSNTITTIANVSFIGNTDINFAGGMYNTSTSNLNIYNTVFYNNTTSSITDIYNDSSSSVTGANNASDGTNAPASTGTLVDLSNITGANTIFTNVTNPAGADGVFGTSDDGLIPTENSPLINMGDNTQNSELLDLAGNTRLFDTTIDIGAYESQTTLSTNKVSTTSINVYPNPTTGYLKINLVNTLKQVQVFTVLGKKVIQSASTELNLSHLPTGIYLLKIETTIGNIITKRIVKQ